MEGSEVLYGRPRPTLTFACAYTAAIGRLLIIVNVRGEGKDMMAVSRAGLAPCTCFGVGMFYTPRVRGLVRVSRTYQNSDIPMLFLAPRTLPNFFFPHVLLFLSSKSHKTCWTQ